MKPFVNMPGLLTYAVKRYMACLLALLFTCVSRGQEISWKADRSQILIGQPLTCRLEMPLPAGDASFTLRIPDSIPHFELLQSPVDTGASNKNFIREWVFTSFDSGSWVLPAFPVLIHQGGNDKTLFTDSIRVEVLYDPSDSTGTMRDIKTVIDVTVVDYTWYYVAGGILLLALLGWAIYYYYWRKRKKGPDAGDTRLTAYDELISALDKLAPQPLHDRQDHVTWHAAISDMVRRYASRRSGKNNMSSTTDDLLLGWGREGLGGDGLSIMADILRTGDAVKFAKYEPSADATRLTASRLRDVAGMIERLKPGH